MCNIDPFWFAKKKKQNKATGMFLAAASSRRMSTLMFARQEIIWLSMQFRPCVWSHPFQATTELNKRTNKHWHGIPNHLLVFNFSFIHQGAKGQAQLIE
jgi:hypothetical protein